MPFVYIADVCLYVMQYVAV